MSDPENAPARPALEAALWIDVRACLAMTRAALKGLRAAAPEVRAVVLESLKDEAAVIEAIAPAKDVDGFHPVSVGRMMQRRPTLLPCTPAGIEALLAFHDIPVAGRSVCILGRGTTLGRPLALLLTQKRPTANAAVTVVHTGVPDWADYTRRAEIVIAAAGVPGILQPEHLSPGVVVVGGGVRYEGRRLLPDVDERCGEVAAAITPRVGGVGPTTVAMLFKNCVEAAERRAGLAG